jgi:hypothetical protein
MSSKWKKLGRRRDDAAVEEEQGRHRSGRCLDKADVSRSTDLENPMEEASLNFSGSS